MTLFGLKRPLLVSTLTKWKQALAQPVNIKKTEQSKARVFILGNGKPATQNIGKKQLANTKPHLNKTSKTTLGKEKVMPQNIGNKLPAPNMRQLKETKKLILGYGKLTMLNIGKKQLANKEPH